MKVSIGRMISNLAARGRAARSRFAWWSRWYPPAPTVGADQFQAEADPYPDHWNRFPGEWPAERTVDPAKVEAALSALPEPWRRVVTLRDVDDRPSTEVQALTGLDAEQQRDVLNRARERLRQLLGREVDRGHDGNGS
jgi:RNA polymerase sigma-70 factor (ECF subfamily)